jgi:hypothetical protein
MKLLVTKNEFKKTNLTVSVSDDLSLVDAYGYDWFKYLHTDDAGNVILSEYTSHSSKSHIGEILDVLRLLNIQIDLRLNFVNEFSQGLNRSIASIHYLGHDGFSLENPVEAINEEIKLIKEHVKELIARIKTKGTRKKKNNERKDEIHDCIKKISHLRNFKNNFLNKKKVKRRKKRLHFSLAEFNNVFSNYIKCNSNDRLKYLNNNFNIKIRSVEPLRLEKISKLFGLNKNFDFTKIAFYRHIVDVENSIPNDVDSIDYKEFLKAIKRLKINKENLNNLQLEKLHVWDINRQLRLERGPSIPREWPSYDVNPILLSLEGELNKDKPIFKLIKSQGDLKKEGRSQKHCIGNDRMGYHERILNKGYQAFNFKGHTFFVDPSLKVVEAHGYRNAYTPSEIKNEIERIIKNQLEKGA